MNKCKNVGAHDCAQRGITLLALIITIVLMLILASITVNVVIDGGLFDYASDAVNSTEIASEKEAVQKATILAESTSKTGRVTVEEMQKAIDNATGKNVATVIDTGDGIIIKFNESNRYYEIGSSGNVEYLGRLKEKTLTLQCADSTGKVVAEKTYTILKEKYSITPPEVEGYEPAVQKIEGEMKENTTISQLYYMVFDDDTTLVFTGLDESGSVTTDEASIVSYMVGDGTTTDGNGLLEKTVQGVLRIPETYKGKQVTAIGQYSFRTTYNIIKADTGDGVESIMSRAFYSSRSITDLTLGKNISDIEGHSFWVCSALKSITFKNSKTSYGLEFGSIEAWTEIKVDDQNTTYKVEDNMLYSADGKTLILCPKGRVGEFTVPETVEVIQEYAFSQTSKITKVTISDSVTAINKSAFYESKIHELVIGKNVTSYGANAFNGCTNLKTVTIRNNIIIPSCASCNMWTEIKVNSENITFKVVDNILYSYDGTKLMQCPQGREEEEYTIIDSVNTIEQWAFERCSKIKSIIIKENVSTIGYAAFCRATIEQITIGKNVTSIGRRAFESCSNLKTVIIDSETIAEQLTTQTACSNLVNVAETIYIKEGITPGSYITNTDNFTVETNDKEGYVKYVKNS